MGVGSLEMAQAVCSELGIPVTALPSIRASAFELQGLGYPTMNDLLIFGLTRNAGMDPYSSPYISHYGPW